MKFVADGMLGKLARWLRLAGHDVVYIGKLNLPSEKQDEEMLEIASKEKGILLTADVVLHKRATKSGLKSILIRETEIAKQLVEISRRLGKRIEIVPENSRCPICNGPLTSVEKNEINNVVPEKVLIANDSFWRCTDCRKIYWKGKHWKNIIETMNQYENMMK
ncbi:MAG: Mut7-C RNAse domain-containing protein [Candidatus Hadarchaeum sp.]